ncbi:MAG: hypothetical protein WDA27_02555 [Actinomycetota bacterium]
MNSVLLSNSLTFYMQVRISVTPASLRIDAPRSILGFLPAGRKALEFPFADIQEIGVAWAVLPTRLPAAVALFAAVVAFTPGIALSIALVVVGLWLLPLSVIKVIRIRPRRGRVRKVPICLFQTFDGELIASEVMTHARAAAQPEPS